MNAAIDIGNTFSKVGFFEHKELVKIYEKCDTVQLLGLMEKYKPERIGLSVVGKVQDILIENLKKQYTLILLDWLTKIPIINRYATPQTLGMDRLAAVIGAHSLFPQEAVLVIDMGTCITYDFLNNQKEYYGGGISVGMQMRFKAMHHFTAKLPLLEAETTPPLVGDSTASCMQSGVVNGMKMEIEGMVDAYKEKFGNFKLILCGGDAFFFASKIKHSNFVDSHLVLRGLNALILHHN
jgi:type III pantothenate kinase